MQNAENRKTNNALLKLKLFFCRVFNAAIQKRYLLSAISGIVTALTMNIPSLFLIAWISLIPLLYSLFIYGKTVKQCFKIMLVYGICFYLILYTWFFALYPLDWLGIKNSNSIIYITLIWAAVSIIQTLQFSLSGVLFGIIKPQKLYSVFAVPFIWIIIEWAQGLTIWGMPWGRLALSQYMFIPSVQSASLFGSLFISFLIVLVNSLVSYSLAKGAKFKRLLFIAAASVFIFNTAFGIIRLNITENNLPQPDIKVAAIQGNFASGTKWDNASQTFDKFKELTVRAAAEGAKVVLWPETAVPVFITDGVNYDLQYKNLADELDIYLITGGFLEKDGLKYSALIMYGPDGKGGTGTAYLKRHLVPFGEYVPYRNFFEKIFPFLSQFRMLGSDLTASTDTLIFDTEYGKMSGLICFDSIFPSFSANDVKNGSQVILIGTNDSYYKDSANPYQHNGHAALRAAENCRYIVRSANTGVSSIISPTGRIIKSTKINTEGYIAGEISCLSNLTLYTLTGDIIVIAGFAFCVFTFIKFRLIKNALLLPKQKN